MKRKRSDKSTAKKSIGAELIEGLTEFRDVLRSGEPVERRLTVRTVKSKRKPLNTKQDDGRAT
jgi:hypothetical protein